MHAPRQRNNLSPRIEYFESLDAFRRRSCPHQISTGHHKISPGTACRLRFTVDPIGPAFHDSVHGQDTATRQIREIDKNIRPNGSSSSLSFFRTLLRHFYIIVNIVDFCGKNIRNIIGKNKNVDFNFNKIMYRENIFKLQFFFYEYQ